MNGCRARVLLLALLNLGCVTNAADLPPTPQAASAAGTAPAPPTAAPEVSPAGTVLIPRGTTIAIDILDPLSSRTSHIDDLFAIALAEPILIDGRIAIPTGTTGKGQVIQAAKAAWGGRAGELVVAARYLDVGGVHVPLGHFQLGQRGRDNTHAALAVAVVVAMPAMFLVSGGETIIPAGTQAIARVGADTRIVAPSAKDAGQ